MGVENPEGVIGRDPQRAKILSAIYGTTAGRSTVCLLEGPIGSGKSALASEARARAAAAGLTVISIAELSLPGGVCAVLQQHGPGPFCLVADDIHRAGPADHAAVEQLIDQGPLSMNAGPSVLILATASPTSDPLTRRLARMAAKTGTRITLRGLTRGELATLLRLHGSHPSHELMTILHARSAGNPGIALRLAEEDLAPEAASRSPIPQQFLRPEVEQMEPCLRTFLEVLALDGGDARAEQAAEVSVQALQDADPGIDPLPTNELIDALSPILSGNGQEVRLEDSAWRETAVALVEPARRRKLHGLLAERTTGLARARHLSAASPVADPELADRLEAQAHTALDAGDYSASATYMALAMSLSQGEERRRRLITAGLTIGLAENPPGAVELSAEIDLVEDIPLTAFFRAGLSFFTGKLSDARSLLYAQLRSPQDAGEHHDLLRWRMLILLGSVEIAAADEHAAQAAVNEARRLGVEPSSRIDAVMSRVLVMHEVYALWNTGCVDEAISRLDVFLIEAEGTAEHTDALYFRGRAHFYAGHTAAALDDLERAEASRHQRVVPAAAQRGMAEQAVMEFHLGRWSDAILRSERVLAMARSTRDWRGLASSHSVLAMVAVAHADETAAAEHLDWLAHHVTTSSALPLYNVMTALVWSARMAGDHERALELISEFRRTRLSSWSDKVGLIGWRALEAGALLHLESPGPDQLRQAERLLESFSQKVARRPGLPLPFGHPQALQGKLSALRGDLDAAVEHYRAAIWLAAEFPHVRARIHHSLGVVHRDRGEHGLADEQFEAAKNIFAQLGAAPELSAVKSRLLSVAGRYTSLTPRERDMAYLISQGRTNREIAEGLFVSVKTVEYHVSNLLPKLGMTSRRELWTAAAVASQRTSPPEQTPGFAPGVHV
ncbi:helix-turn-helix transcriptional regulator [Nesterenkonia lutea]|uniref:DNA-binding CsgD family transcriptional regulator n=1 Tax=Nesterenkonia lutea TaxID=272919 RepID=A0ABR9JET3_9MICC|nr:LuxR C-terminal-related transcriptional regulator [Nesterenkonia lutea]MBE1524438.1 DNA-binding CsgD family transcriptional regulator [Nesterenkonia lutea]